MFVFSAWRLYNILSKEFVWITYVQIPIITYLIISSFTLF